MNTLDSRSLGIGDCFAVKFAAEGAVRHILSFGGHRPLTIGADEGFAITVKAKADPVAAPKVHYLQVTKLGNQLVHSATAGLAVESGDTVLWYTTDYAVTGFAVAGSSKDFAFANNALKAEAIYTHAFGVPGTYEWADLAIRSISGTVVVKPAAPKNDKEKQDWLDSLTKGASFEIRGGKVTPANVEIVVGQTVFWKAWDGDGLCIVDKRLLT